MNSIGLKSSLSDHFIPPMIPGYPPASPRHISPANRVTTRISMKTIIKPRMPFFPSCIMDLGALASSEYAACGDSPIYSCAGLWRPRLVFTLPFAAPRIFDN